MGLRGGAGPHVGKLISPDLCLGCCQLSLDKVAYKALWEACMGGPWMGAVSSAGSLLSSRQVL